MGLTQLTVCIFEGLFLLGGFGDDLDSFAEKEPNVGAVPVQHLHRQHEVFAFIRVADVQRLGCAEVLKNGTETFISAFTSLHHEGTSKSCNWHTDKKLAEHDRTSAVDLRRKKLLLIVNVDEKRDQWI